MKQGHQVTAYDSINETLYPDSGRRSRAEELVSKGLEFVSKDAADITPDQVAGVDAIVNLAAIPGLEPSWRHFGDYFRENTVLVQHLASLAAEAGTHFVQISTSSVYGSVAAPGAQLLPNSPYGVSKLAAEHTIRAFASEKGLEYSILRLFSVYGPKQRPDQFLGKIVDLLRSDLAIPITGDGSQSRAFTYVQDVVHAISLTIERPPLNDSLDICGSEEKTILEIVEILGRKLGKAPQVEFRPSRVGDQRSTSGDLSKTFEALTWRPETPLAVGLENMANSLLSTSGSVETH